MKLSLWKEQIQDVIQKKPLKTITTKLGAMSVEDWNELDAKLGDSIVRLHLAKPVYFFPVVNEKTTHELREKLCATYEKETTSDKVYLMKRLFEPQMKEGGSIALYLDEFIIIFNQLREQKLNFDAKMKEISLSCSLLSS